MPEPIGVSAALRGEILLDDSYGRQKAELSQFTAMPGRLAPDFKRIEEEFSAQEPAFLPADTIKSAAVCGGFLYAESGMRSSDP
jgi:hypothetical protein